jgi:hypothetical protein
MIMADNGKQLPVLKVTSAKEWRKPREEGFIVPLPSGFMPRLRMVGIEELVRRGTIPDDLTSLAAEMVYEKNAAVEIVRSLGKGAIDFLNLVVASAFIEPKVSFEAELKDDEISIDDIDLMDKQAVFAFVTGPTQALRLFRLQQEFDVAALASGEQNGKQTERHSQD